MCRQFSDQSISALLFFAKRCACRRLFAFHICKLSNVCFTFANDESLPSQSNLPNFPIVSHPQVSPAFASLPYCHNLVRLCTNFIRPVRTQKAIGRSTNMIFDNASSRCKHSGFVSDTGNLRLDRDYVNIEGHSRDLKGLTLRKD